MCDYIIVVSKTWTCLHCAQIWGKNISQAKFRTISAKNQIGKMNTQLFHSALGVATFEHPMKSLKKSRQWTENCYSVQYPTKPLRLFNQGQRLRLNCCRQQVLYIAMQWWARAFFSTRYNYLCCSKIPFALEFLQTAIIFLTQKWHIF